MIDYRIDDADRDGRSNHEWAHDKPTRTKGFPGHYEVKLSRVAVAAHCTDQGVADDLAPNSRNAVQEMSGIRWEIEQLYGELDQSTCIAENQRRKARIQQNHAARAVLVWLRFTDMARKTQQTASRIKHGSLVDYLCQQFNCLSVTMRLA